MSSLGVMLVYLLVELKIIRASFFFLLLRKAMAEIWMDIHTNYNEIKQSAPLKSHEI